MLLLHNVLIPAQGRADLVLLEQGLLHLLHRLQDVPLSLLLRTGGQGRAGLEADGADREGIKNQFETSESGQNASKAESLFDRGIFVSRKEARR